MGLYEMTAGTIVPVAATTFATEQVMERADLQRALRQDISPLGDDLLVVAEEFGDFDVRRRIDLLCVDTAGRLVVVELKRTEDGGHMELQALRYAAMVSAMTFDQLADTYARHLQATNPDHADQAREQLAEWLEEVGGVDAVLERHVRIVLVSAGFDPQITTTVLWLNDLYGLDVTCVKLVPYRVGDKLLLDVQQVIPLPEASEITVQLRRRESAARAAASGGRDWTPYTITSSAGSTEPLRKRHAVLAMVTALHQAGVPAADMVGALPGRSRLLAVDGTHDGQALREAFTAAYPRAASATGRWFLERPLHDGGRTWVLSKQWGTNTETVLDALLALAPGGGISYEAARR